MAQLPYLEAFLAIHRTGSLTRAARIVHLTQAALSHQLKALETSVGRPLFARVPRGLRPLPAADDLARAVAPHLDALAAIGEDARARGGKDAPGPIFLGGPAEFMSERVIPALAPLIARGTRLHFQFGVAAALIEEVAAGHLDMAVATVRVPRSGVDYDRLCEEEFTLVAGTGWAERIPRRAVERRGAAALQGIPFIAYGDDLPIIRRYYRVVFNTRAPARAALVAPDLRAVLAAVIAGAGVSVLPRYLCRRSLHSGELVELFSPAQAPHNTLYSAVRAGADRGRLSATVEILRGSASLAE